MINGLEKNVGVYNGAVAIFRGTSIIGDITDPQGLSIHENSGVSVEESRA